MKTIRNIVKALVPKTLINYIRGKHRNFIFSRAMTRYMNEPADCTTSGNQVLRDLIYGWGNEGWSSLDEYLAGGISHALSASGPILECGSGLSTLLIGIIAKNKGQKHWVLEHTPEWAAKVKQYLVHYGIDSVVLHVKPIKDYGEFHWYEPPLESMPAAFSLVICDGPPARTKGGRYGLVPIMKERLKPGCVILLDDAVREQEREIAKRWESELGAVSKNLGLSKPYIEMTITGK